jgi:hypothetical protein
VEAMTPPVHKCFFTNYKKRSSAVSKIYILW